MFIHMIKYQTVKEKKKEETILSTDENDKPIYIFYNVHNFLIRVCPNLYYQYLSKSEKRKNVDHIFS